MSDDEKIVSIEQAKKSLLSAWPMIRNECLSILGSELHYQAMIYHCLRNYGSVPASQLGMNVKMLVKRPVSELFKVLDIKKHPKFRGGFEPIPDIVIFKPEIDCDWRRRNNENTLVNMIIAIEVKASERQGSRLGSKEIIRDIEKLAAHREEVIHRGAEVFPVIVVIDSAPSEEERMTSKAIDEIVHKAGEINVGVLYCSPILEINTIANDRSVFHAP